MQFHIDAGTVRMLAWIFARWEPTTIDSIDIMYDRDIELTLHTGQHIRVYYYHDEYTVYMNGMKLNGVDTNVSKSD